MTELDQLSINALRFLAVDAVRRRRAGTLGRLWAIPNDLFLFHEFMRHNPANSKWSNRDRFVLSNGHASALLYSVLHLTVTKSPLRICSSFASRLHHARIPSTATRTG